MKAEGYAAPEGEKFEHGYVIVVSIFENCPEGRKLKEYKNFCCEFGEWVRAD